MAVDAVTARLNELATEVAALLNGTADDDERERVQQVYEQRLNDELFHGAEVRVMRSLADVVRLPTRLREVTASEGGLRCS